MEGITQFVPVALPPNGQCERLKAGEWSPLVSRTGNKGDTATSPWSAATETKAIQHNPMLPVELPIDPARTTDSGTAN
ncbi:hypothetical protein WDW86_21335 [Bdellovibrionota bacterium FG-2]